MEGVLVNAGLGAPWQRMIFGGVAVAGVALYLKPEFACRKDGTMRPWAVCCDEKDATHVPFFLLPFLGATFGIFL